MKSRLACFFLASTAAIFAQIVPDAGTYSTPDGAYSINVTAADDAVTVIEPNKRSVYTKVGPNEYKFVNPKNDIEYRLEVVSKTEIAFFKPASRDNRTRLKLSGGAAQGASNDKFEKYSKIAEAYQAKVESHPEDTQLWIMCAATAMARATMNDDGFQEYARQATVAIKALLENKSKNPCPDVIPAAIWNSVKE